jgi:hypothetical protein
MTAFIFLFRTNIQEFREWALSATAAPQLVSAQVQLRRPGVLIEDDQGEPRIVLPAEKLGRGRESEEK